MKRSLYTSKIGETLMIAKGLRTTTTMKRAIMPSLCIRTSSFSSAATTKTSAAQYQQQEVKGKGPISSISFSGAGFLGSYHLGVSACLVEHGHLLGPGEIPSSPSSHDGVFHHPILTGVSAGSLVSAGISAGIKPEDGMKIVYEASHQTKKIGGLLDVLTPGFSLIDQIESILLKEMKAAIDDDWDLFLRRTNNGQKLRLGLMDKRKIGIEDIANIHGALDSYCYVDQFRSLEDVVAVCILSSYIPGITGTLKGTACKKNGAVRRSFRLLREMVNLGYVKDGRTGLPVPGDQAEVEEMGDGKESDDISTYFWDGGLADVFPTIDGSTIIVSPVNGIYDNPSISPPIPSSSRRMLKAHPLASFAINRENGKALFECMKSSNDDVLEDWFHQGYDAARDFLSDRNMLTVSTIRSAALDGGEQKKKLPDKEEEKENNLGTA